MNILSSLLFITTLIISTLGTDPYGIGYEPMCCTQKRMTTKWIATCPTFYDENTCEYKKNGKANKCRWTECSNVGYCEWNGSKVGNNGNIEKLCLRQANKPKCINKIFAGSAACVWVDAAPPEEYIAALNLNDIDEDEIEEETEDLEFVVVSNNNNLEFGAESAKDGISEYLYLLFGLIWICSVGSLAIYSKCKYNEDNVKEHQPLLTGQV